MIQQELFTPPSRAAAGVKARDKALKQVLKNVPPEWRKAALAAIKTLARSDRHFTSEDITMLVGKPPEPRALGAVFRTAQDMGLIVPTGRFVPAEDPTRHRAPIREWRGAR